MKHQEDYLATIKNLRDELKESKNKEMELNKVIVGLVATIERLSNRPT